MKKESKTDPKFSSYAASEQDPALLKLFKDSLMDIYWAENHLTKKLPLMAEAATAKKLKQAIENHLAETEGHVARLQQVFELMGEQPLAKKCEAMDGLTMEGQEIIESTEPGSASRDVGIILASQKVEHYEIATYGGLHQLAGVLGLTEVADQLALTLEEEKKADQLLTKIATSEINYQAAEEA
ncbi:ferritin-like domain-containing protein [Mucilaginibacter daejeonensis]|uniref:YciE/YciF ferroxidase family protein n=1 Tax=Mucilaginibacter daejeonensis TaxID=398049 RepID=UPI001D1710A5|nr:ferritin-like domain-containing protein [Mucilaginibacter daejeonensis]UEG54152.1 ferritin-like domain-containing protein [Mucilaginibacter daejeonensis]